MKYPRGDGKFRAVILLALVSMVTGCDEPSEALPALPPIDLDSLQRPVREHLSTELENMAARRNDAEANGRVAMVLHTYRLNEAADIAYQRVRLLEPDAFAWPYLHGIVLESLSRNDEANQAYRAADNIQSGYLPLRQRFAELMVNSGRVDIGRDLYRQLADARPDLPTVQYGLGKVLALQGEPEQAAQAFAKAIDIRPDYGAAHYALASVLRQQGDTAGASAQLALFEQFEDVQIRIDDPVLARVTALSRTQRGLYNAALRYLQQRNPVKAAETFELVLRDTPDDYGAHSNLVGLYGDLRQPDKAEEHYQAALRLRPDHPKLHNNIGIVRYRFNKRELAAASFAQAVRLDPAYAAAWKNLGRVQQDMGDRDSALASYRKSIELNDQDKQALNFYGRLLTAVGRPDEAIAPLTEAIAPGQATEAHYLRHLADAQSAIGDTNAAIATLEKARSIAQRLGQDGVLGQIEADLRASGEQNTTSAVP